VKACSGLEAEIIVVDNASVDQSRSMMESNFPEVQYYYLESNLGFSKANNFGISKSKGKYILLLNPDTIVQENTLSSTIEFMDQHPMAGGLGVHMIDGNGVFLPESKRGLPTPAAAFYKISGLSRLFPKSKKFGRYHQGFLDETKTHEVEILSGAFMLMRSEVLEKIGGLDEDYFMYGEDIDLSYRIIQAGYKNYYFSGTSIVHYKGESTKKGSVNYVFVFYRAMVIFARKHFEKDSASLFSIIINVAIYFRATIALIRRLIGRYWQVLLDFLTLYLAFLVSTRFYETYGAKDFSLEFVNWLLPVYAAIMAMAIEFSGANDKPSSGSKLLRSWLVAMVVLLAFYALIPESYRFSRAVLLIGSLVGLGVSMLWRIIRELFVTKSRKSPDFIPKRRLFLGQLSGFNKTKEILNLTNHSSEFLAAISSTVDSESEGFLGTTEQLPTAILEFRIEEVIVDSDSCSYKQVLEVINDSKKLDVKVKILNKNWMIGPNTVIKAHRFQAGNKLSHLNLSSITRMKRLSDLMISFLLLPISPVLIFFIDSPGGFIKNWFQSTSGIISWIGYDRRGLDPKLPKIKKGIIYSSIDTFWPEHEVESIFNNNVSYLLNHSTLLDLHLVFRNIHHLGNRGA
jgi:O-antigen biosynthesis protein